MGAEGRHSSGCIALKLNSCGVNLHGKVIFGELLDSGKEYCQTSRWAFTVTVTRLFGAACPGWLGTIGRLLLALFRIMTLESWSTGIFRSVMEKFPCAWTFFIPFIPIAAITMLNLFIAVIADAMQSYCMEVQKETVPANKETQAQIDGNVCEPVRRLASARLAAACHLARLQPIIPDVPSVPSLANSI